MSESAEHIDVHRLRENSLWTDVKGRKLLVQRRWMQWNGVIWEVSSVDLLLLDELSVVTRPHKELAALISDGRMKYYGECSLKVSVPGVVTP